MQIEPQIINEAASATGTSSSDAFSQEPERIHVLLVEDNPGDATLIRMMLEEAGFDLFELEVVGRLSDGLAKVANGRIGLVLLDLSLPDSQGLDTFLQFHAKAPSVPIIVLSGLNDTQVAVQAVHEGAQDFLVKGQVEGQLLVRAMRYAIERKRMAAELSRYAEELRSQNAQLEADFNMAREIQQIFIPHQYPTFPPRVPADKSALRFSHRYLPAAAVGGDFFDVLSINPTTAGVFICDVMGHGMRAALVTAIMRGLVEELVSAAGDPGQFLTEINRSLHTILRRTREPLLATAFYLVADVASGELRYASTGHPSPFRMQRSTGTVEPLNQQDPRHGPALGLFEKPVYPSCRSVLAPGDRILLFTDGLFEVNNPQQQEYGQQRLLFSVRKHQQLPTETLLDTLIDEAQQFANSSEFEDDVCLLAMEVHRVG